MPAKAGIHSYLKILDSRLHGNDAKGDLQAFYETINLEEPQKIALLGSLQILRINNVGCKSLREISSALYSLGIIKNEGEWLYSFLKRI